jgi:dihydrofolate reductase
MNRRVVMINNVSLDGVMQAPGRADEDTRGGFAHGGWATLANDDEVLGRAMGERMAQGGPLLFGRWTYEDFYTYWPHQTDNPFTDVLNNVQKYVASRTLAEPLPWSNSMLLDGAITEAVARLRQDDGPDLGILGSGELCRSLMAANLIDEYVLVVHPIVLGAGQRLFPHDGPFQRLRLIDALPTPSGIVVTTYRPA